MLSVFLTLAVVLGVMGIALKLLRKYTMGGATRNGTIKMEVLQRLTLGQRQGLAVVRIGTRVLAVSMGDGGVHPVAELDSGELSAEEAATPGEVVTLNVSKVADSLRAMVPVRKADVAASTTPTATPTATPAAAAEATTTTQTHRISYIAPMEDFQAVLNMAMSGAARS
jgi:flagellar biogenesis protein FliO